MNLVELPSMPVSLSWPELAVHALAATYQPNPA
jgi:hypothetical protein